MLATRRSEVHQAYTVTEKAIKSLNSNYYESHFSSLLSHIGRLGESIIHKAEAGNQARLRDVQKEVHELRRERQLFEEVFGQDRTAQSEMLHKLMLNLEAKQREEAAASLSIGNQSIPTGRKDQANGLI